MAEASIVHSPQKVWPPVYHSVFKVLYCDGVEFETMEVNLGLFRNKRSLLGYKPVGRALLVLSSVWELAFLINIT